MNAACKPLPNHPPICQTVTQAQQLGFITGWTSHICENLIATGSALNLSLKLWRYFTFIQYSKLFSIFFAHRCSATGCLRWRIGEHRRFLKSSVGNPRRWLDLGLSWFWFLSPVFICIPTSSGSSHNQRARAKRESLAAYRFNLSSDGLEWGWSLLCKLWGRPPAFTQDLLAYTSWVTLTL